MLAFDPLADPPTDEQRRVRRELAGQAEAVWSDGPAHVLDRCLALAGDWGVRLPTPGSGQTAELWLTLAEVGARDLTAARVLEPHLDALAITAQAGVETAPGRWGVFAAESHGSRLTAVPDADRWRLSGRKPWCSLAGRLDRALVTAWTGDTRRRLFAIDLRDPGVDVEHQGWAAHGLPLVVSGAIDLDAVEAQPVGGDGWYLDRPGFAWGGIGVAAIWWGAAAALVARLHEQAGRRRPDQVALMHLGAADAAHHAAGVVLATAAAAVDAGRADGPDGSALALRVRQVVRRAAEDVLERCAHALGPGPLAHEREHVRRVSDLTLYLRQEHAERDQAALGRTLLGPDVATGWR